MIANSASGSRQPSELSELFRAVQRFQRTYCTWGSEHDSVRRAALRDELRRCNEEIWNLLAEPLQSVAHRWLNSGVGREIRAHVLECDYQQDALKTLTMHLYFPILKALPTLQIDPEKNLLGCLMIIAQRGISNENQHIYAAKSGRASESTIEPLSESGTPAAAMWPINGHGNHAADRSADAEDQADPATYDLEDQLVRAIDGQRCLEEARAFWQCDLELADRQILALRWQTTPPTDFKTVAQHMGPGWTVEAVRQRHSRIIRRTRKHLQEKGWLDDEGYLAKSVNH